MIFKPSWEVVVPLRTAPARSAEVECGARNCKHVVRPRDREGQNGPYFCSYRCAVEGQPEHAKPVQHNLRGQG